MFEFLFWYFFVNLRLAISSPYIYFNKQKFPYIQELKDLRFKMLSEDLGGSFSLVDQKSYLEKLRSLIKF
jgi:hypothetical protein